MIDLSKLKIPGPDVVPEPNDFSFQQWNSEVVKLSGHGLSTQIACAALRRCRELELNALRADAANIERKQIEIASLRNACRMHESAIEELRKEIADYHGA